MDTSRKLIRVVPADDSQIVGEGNACTIRQENFAQQVVKLGNKAAAYRLAYDVHPDTAPGSVWRAASDLSNKPHIAARIQELQEQRTLELIVTAQQALQWQLDIATADPNELGCVVKRCCRHCYGVNHGYQWKDADEFTFAMARAITDDEPIPSDTGGYGYLRIREPAVDCPSCFGVGVEEVILNDTTKLTGKARKLFKGLDYKNGQWVVLLHDQEKAWDKIFRVLGAYKDPVQMKKPAADAAASKITDEMTEQEATRRYLAQLG